MLNSGGAVNNASVTGAIVTAPQASEREWRRYYAAALQDPPRATLLHALERFAAEAHVPRERFAVDLGSGTGRDTLELLRRGWRVLASTNSSTPLAPAGTMRATYRSGT